MVMPRSRSMSHVVQQLILGLPGADGTGAFHQTVRQSRFPMIDVGDDAKISNELLLQ